MAKPKVTVLYRREVDGKVLELTQREGLYQLVLTTVLPDRSIQHSVTLTDTIEPPIQHARRT